MVVLLIFLEDPQGILGQCDGTCVLDEMKSPSITLTLPWQGREEEVAKIKRAVIKNLWAHSVSENTKQYYNFILLYGPSGVGKSSLGYRAFENIKLGFSSATFIDGISPGKSSKHITKTSSVQSIFSGVHYLFTDFSAADRLSRDEELARVRTNVILGLRLAAAFFLQSSVGTILDTLKRSGSFNTIHEFTLEKVAQLISARIPSNQQIALVWQLDEFHHLLQFDGIVKEMISTLGTFMKDKQHYKIAIIPMFIGTASMKIANEIMISQFGFIDIFLRKLNRSQSWSIMDTRLAKHKKILQRAPLDQALCQLGDWPRFLQLFCDLFDDLLDNCGPDVCAYFSLVLQNTRDRIKYVYSTSRWEVLLGGQKTALHNMCLYALTRKRVTLHDKLNGLTVGDVRDTGILMLDPAGTSVADQYGVAQGLVVWKMAVN